MIDPRLLEMLVCPATKAPLRYRPEADELWCAASGLAYPIRDGVPVMLTDQARQLTAAELAELGGGRVEGQAAGASGRPAGDADG